jgi:hypothetical protein
MAQMPDFRAQYQIPMAAVIDSYRQKAVDEQNMRMQNEQLAMQKKQEPLNNLMKMASLVQMGQSIASNMVANSTQKQMANARVTYSELLGKGNELVPSETMGQAKLFTNTPTGREYTSVPTNETVPYSTTPEYSQAAEQAFQTAYPDAYVARKSKDYDPSPLGVESQRGQFDDRQVIFPDGTIGIVRIDKFNNQVSRLGSGEVLSPEIASSLRPAYAPMAIQTNQGIRVVPRTPGEYSTVAEGVRTGEKKESVPQLERQELLRLEDTKKKFLSDPAVKASITKKAEMDSAEAALSTKNWVGDATILSIAAKGLGRDAGNLSESEQERYRSSPELDRRIATKANRWAKGTITDSDREDFKEAIRIAKLKQEDILNGRLDVFTNSAEKQVKNADRKFLSGYIYDQGTLPPMSNDSAINKYFDKLLSGGN